VRPLNCGFGEESINLGGRIRLTDANALLRLNASIGI